MSDTTVVIARDLRWCTRGPRDQVGTEVFQVTGSEINGRVWRTKLGHWSASSGTETSEVSFRHQADAVDWVLQQGHRPL